MTKREEQTGERWTETEIVIKTEIETGIETEIEPEVAETRSGTEIETMIGREIRKTGEEKGGAKMVRNDITSLTKKTKRRNDIRKIPLEYLTFLLLAVKC